jgi:uncharacterized protein (TIGR03437 family)
MVDSQTGTPSFSLADAISFASSTGVRYMEVWNQDLVNSRLESLLTGAAAALASRAVTTASAATWLGGSVAAGSLAVASGIGLANQTASATSLPLATTLGSTTVSITDVAGSSFAAALFYVSPTQINFVLPDSAAPGAATIAITNTVAGDSSGALQIDTVQPGIFTANQTGTGLPAAQAILVTADGSQTSESVYQCTAASCTATPIDLGGAGDTAYLILYGTGIRNRTSLDAVSVTAGGVAAGVDYAGPSGTMPGLDQVNARLPASLAGRGKVEIVLTVDGVAANTVEVSIR